MGSERIHIKPVWNGTHRRCRHHRETTQHKTTKEKDTHTHTAIQSARGTQGSDVCCLHALVVSILLLCVGWAGRRQVSSLYRYPYRCACTMTDLRHIDRVVCKWCPAGRTQMWVISLFSSSFFSSPFNDQFNWLTHATRTTMRTTQRKRQTHKEKEKAVRKVENRVIWCGGTYVALFLFDELPLIELSDKEDT